MTSPPNTGPWPDAYNETTQTSGSANGPGPTADPLPTRFVGTVMISPDRPAREIHQIVETVVEQLTTLSGCEVTIKLEIDAERPDGFERAKVRTVLENANTLGFVDKAFR